MARCLASSRTGIRAVILLAMAAWQLPEGVLARTQVVQPRSVPLRALSTPPAESSRSECSIRELGRLLDLNEAEIDVREAAGMEGDCVAQLRCSVFGQGKDMYRSQRHKMRTSPHYLLAGIYKTTLMVAVVRALTPRARQVCKEIVLADMQELLDQAWISPWEHAHLLERLEHEWQPRSELVVGSVDCSVHEMFDSSLTLRRWVYVSSMAVREDVRQRGVGEQLLNLGVAHARKIFGVKHMFLHVEELNGAALRLYQRAGFARGDIEDSHISSMDRMLRLVLQVPVAATLYMRSLSLLAEESIQDEGTGAGAARRRPRLTTHAAPEQANHMHHAAPAQSNRMHHVAERLAVQQVARRVEVSHSMALRSTADVAAPGVAKQERERSRRRVAVTHVGKHAAAASESTAPRGPAL